MPTMSLAAFEAASELAVLWGGFRIPRWVAVGDREGGGAVHDGGLENLAGMHQGRGEAADADGLDADEAVLGGEVDAQEVFAVRAGDESQALL